MSLRTACWFGQSSAQCNCNDTACRNQAMQDNPDTQMCCTWVPQPIDTDPNSLNDANGTPLGFRLDEYQGTDSNLPDLCVRVNYPTPRENVRYVVVSVSLACSFVSTSTVYIQQLNLTITIAYGLKCVWNHAAYI